MTLTPDPLSSKRKCTSEGSKGAELAGRIYFVKRLIGVASYYEVPVVQQWLSHPKEAKNLGVAQYMVLGVSAVWSAAEGRPGGSLVYY